MHIAITGLRDTITPNKQREVEHAIMNTLNIKLDGETDGVTIRFGDDF